MRRRKNLVGLGPEAPRVVYLAIMCGEVSVSVMEASTNTLLDHSSDCAAYVGKAKSGDDAYLIVLLPEWTAVYSKEMLVTMHAWRRLLACYWLRR